MTHPKLLPPEGQPDGTTYVLQNSNGARSLWIFRNGKWYGQQSMLQIGSTPYIMWKSGWRFAERDNP